MTEVMVTGDDRGDGTEMVGTDMMVTGLKGQG